MRHRPALNAEEERAWQAIYTIARCLPGLLDRQLSADAGLGHYEYAVLHVLYESAGRESTMARLAEATSATFSRLSHAVDRLEARSLLRRSRRGAHRVVTLTDEGARAFRAAAAGHMDQIRTHVLDLLPADGLAQLAVLLAPVADHLKENIERG